MRTHKILLLLFIMILPLWPQGKKVETDTLKFRYGFKMRSGGVWYDTTSFFNNLNTSNQLLTAGIANGAVTGAKIGTGAITGDNIANKTLYYSKLAIDEYGYGLGGAREGRLPADIGLEDSTITRAKLSPTINHLLDNPGSGSRAFSGTAITDTVTVANAGINDRYWITPKGSSISINDILSVEPISGGFVVYRLVSGTSELNYFWKREDNTN